MCGISGIFGLHPNHQAVERMVAAMHHRGPNDRGIFVASNVVLGMTRLAILDLSQAAHQPMGNDDGSVWIVYNGETYSFGMERQRLEAKGIRFRSHSDTEVLLRLYESEGDAFLPRLRGMFALAIYDRRQGEDRARLLLARDHLGIKPLLYTEKDGALVFASELKALLASGLVSRDIDPQALRQFLTFGSVIQPHTLLRDVRMLLPAHKILCDARGVHVERYWSLGTRRADTQDASEVELIDHTAALIEESVQMQMVSDVPLGAFLSGGLDSSLIAAFMARHSPHKLRTFSIGFLPGEQAVDESEDAARIAQFIGTEHTRVAIDGVKVHDHLLHLAKALDQPSLDGANAYFVSWAARQSVTVAVSGTGGDELFAGYPWFLQMVRMEQEDARKPARAAMRKRLAQIAASPLFDPFAARGNPLLLRLRGGNFVQRYARHFCAFAIPKVTALLNPTLRRGADVGRDPALDLEHTDELPTANALNRVTALCLRGYTTNQLLRDIDAVSMAHSLEVRVPLLDPVLADWALSLPDTLKLDPNAAATARRDSSYRETGAKRVLVEIGVRHKLVPPDLDRQPKRGFGMPFGPWLRGPLRPFLDDTLDPVSVRKRGWLDPIAVRLVHDQFLTNLEASWAQVWMLMMLELWARAVLDAPVTTSLGC